MVYILVNLGALRRINESEEKAIDTQSYTTSEVTRIGKVAFDLAKKRE